MAPAGVVAHSSSWTPAAYELEECSSSEEASHEVLYQNFLMVWREQGDKVVYVLTGPTACKPPGTGAVQKYWNRGLPLFASGHYVSFLPVSVPRGRCVGVLGLRFVVQDVAASLWLAVAAAAVRLEFDVAASLWPAVAAAAISTKDDAASLPPTVAAAAHSE